MTFILSKVLWGLLRPSSLLILMGVLGLILTWISWRRLGMTLLTLCVAGFLAVWLLPVDQWALLPLEDRFSRPYPPPAHVDGIIVLGGVIDNPLSLDRGIPSLNDAAERITEAVALSRRYPDARLMFSGGSGELVPNLPSEASEAKKLFEALGVTKPIILEDRSRNTYENVIFSRAIAQPKPGEVWLLVTSASHMPRAVGLFRKAGWPVVPWPVAYKTGHSPKVQLTREFGDKFMHFDWAAHEWVGLVSYWLMGRTDALFPGPNN